MADASSAPLLPPLTRLGRAAALLAGEGVAVGFALGTFRLWSRLPNFVATNKMSTVERANVLAWLVVPAAIWLAVVFGVAMVRRSGARPLAYIERCAERGAWVMAAGLTPLLFHPAIWRTRILMFLLTTGIATLVAWWAIRLTQKGIGGRQANAADSDLSRMGSCLLTWIPPKLRATAPSLLVGLAVAYITLRGVWLDPTAVPRNFGDPPVGVHSAGQGFRILGHGGWLSMAIASVKFLRPPGHAHIVVWVLCISSAAVALFAWARRHLGVGIALAVALIYLGMPALQTVGRTEVVPLGVAAGPFFLAISAWERRNLGRAALLTLITVGIHEQAALWFACYGLYVAGIAKSADVRRWLVLGGITYFALIAFVLLPHFDIGLYRQGFRGLWGSNPVGLVESLGVVSTNPAYVLSKWFERQEMEFWLVLFVPFAFIPLTSRNWLMWAMPGCVFVVAALGRVPVLPIAAGGAAHFIVLGFVASVTTLEHLRRDPWSRGRAHAAVAAWVFAILPCVWQLGGLYRPAP